MALPIQLKFFKKIELYQEIKFQNEKAKEAGQEGLRKIWKTEKNILKWTARHHHCLGSAIDHAYIRENILGSDKKDEFDWSLTPTTDNLIQRNFPVKKEGSIIEIYFTPTGLLMGEVIDETEGDCWLSKWKYKMFFCLVWLTAISGALIVIINFFEKIFELCQK